MSVSVATYVIFHPDVLSGTLLHLCSPCSHSSNPTTEIQKTESKLQNILADHCTHSTYYAVCNYLTNTLLQIQYALTEFHSDHHSPVDFMGTTFLLWKNGLFYLFSNLKLFCLSVQRAPLLTDDSCLQSEDTTEQKSTESPNSWCDR